MVFLLFFYFRPVFVKYFTEENEHILYTKLKLEKECPVLTDRFREFLPER